MNWTHLLAVDSNEWACATYRANMPGVPVLCEMVDPDRIAARITEPVDVLLGGPPCQPFSAAGKGEGADDERDGFPAFLATVNALRPRHAIAENVPGVLFEKHSAHYLRFIAGLESLGYRVQYRELDAADFGVPQFRRRVWAWAIREDVARSGVTHHWPMPTHAAPEKCAGLFGSLKPWVTCGQALGIVGWGGRIEGASGWSGQRVLDADAPAHAVTGANNPELVRVEANDGINRDWYDPNAQPSRTIRCAGTRPAVRVVGGGTNPRGPGAEQDRTERDITGEPSTTIACDAGNAMPAVEYRWSDEYRAKHPPAEPAEPAPTVVSSWAKGAPNGMVRLDTEQGERVRRLTPEQCARLQSCPDDWVWPEKMPKTHKYRVIGNGWACRMAAAMAEVVRDADPELRKRAGTVVDLFCGGGLGAVGWSGRYWRAEVHA